MGVTHPGTVGATLPEPPGAIHPGTVARELYRYAADLDLLVCGPQYWFYPSSGDAAIWGVDGRHTGTGVLPRIMSDTRFTFEVALPVQGKIPTALLPYFKQIPAFRCLSSRYEGPWEGIGQHYVQMMRYIEENQLEMSGIYAESFLHIDIDQPDNHITEIMIGLC
jgi:effector-binding domain-containing protein